MSFLADVGRAVAVADRVVPFTGRSYDDAFADRLSSRGLPHVGMTRAMGLPAAYACTVVVSEDIAKVPFQIFEQSGESRKAARNHPLYDLLHDQASEEYTALEFREWMTAVALNRGEAVAEKVPGPRGLVDQLVPLHPDRVSWETVKPGVRRLAYNDPDRGTRYLTRDEVFVLRGRFGVGVVTVMRQPFSTQLAMQGYQSDMYERGMRSPGSLTHPKTLSDPARKRLREVLDKYITGGERAGRPLLLEEGMEWKTIALSNTDAQFLETIQHSVADVCRAYRVPQHKVQELLRSTNNNIEQQSVDYVVDSVLGWAIRWEQSVRRDLIIAQARFFAKHNLDGLLRGDTKTRYEAYAIAVSLGWITRSEVRAKEDMDPLDDQWGLDEPLVPLNMGNVPGTGVAVDGGQRFGAIGPQPSSPAVVSMLRRHVRSGAARLVRVETAELRKLARKGGDWEASVGSFYDGHAEEVARVMLCHPETAQRYCVERRALLAASGPALLDDDIDHMQAVATLTRVALREADILQDDTFDELGAAA